VLDANGSWLLDVDSGRYHVTKLLLKHDYWSLLGFFTKNCDQVHSLRVKVA
jgi:hypothetical protein